MKFQHNRRTGRMEMVRPKHVTDHDRFAALGGAVETRTFRPLVHAARNRGLEYRAFSGYLSRVISRYGAQEVEVIVERIARGDSQNGRLGTLANVWLWLWAQAEFKESVVPYFVALRGVSNPAQVIAVAIPCIEEMVTARVPPSYLKSLVDAGATDFSGVAAAWQAGAPVEYAVSGA